MKSYMYDSMYRQGLTHWWFRGKQEIVLGLLDSFYDPSQGSLIDFGCGCGAMLQALSRYGTVTGADFSEQALEYCRRHFNGELRRLDLSQPSDFSEQYQAGVALDILEHIQADQTAAENIYRALAPGGKCVITVPANQWMWSAHDENCMHVRRYNRETLQSLLLNAGFELEYISYYNFFLFLPIAAVRILAKLLHLDRDSSMETVTHDGWMNRLLYRIFRAERTWIQARRRFPFGVSLIALVSKPEWQQTRKG